MLKPLFLIGFFISCIPNSSCLFNDTIGAGDLLKRVVERLNGIRVTNTSEACSQAYERFREFSADFQALHKYEVPPPELLEIPPPEWKSERKLYLERSRIGTVYVEIDGAVSQILQELKFHQERSKYSGIKRFPRVIDEFLAGLRSMITPLRDVDFWEDGYFYLMARRQRNNTQCGEDHNLQNFLIKIYKMVVLTEIEAHAISALTYACQYGPLETNVRSSGYMDERRRNLPRHLNKQLVAYSKALSKSLEVISPSYFRYCDSTYNSWIQDVSFFELDGFLQSVILRYESRSCNANCWDIWDKNACPREWIDKRTGCNGQVTACAWLGDVRACALAHGPHKYKWVDSSVHGMLGNNSDSCPQGQGYYIGTEPRAGHNAESGCNCDCLENKWKVYLGPLESRESDNYVIVGVRFRVKNHMLFLQPAQGKLHPNGYIVDYEWVDLPNVIHSEYIGNIDLIHRSFFLDDLQLKPGHALTGIQFHGAQRGNSAQFKGFEISISGRPLDYETGKLDLTLANKYVDRGPRSNIEKELIYQRVRPVDEEIFNRLELSSQEFTYVTLHHSKLNDDFGQSTLPLFDSTPVLMKTHSPLAGISILHKGSKHNSGFFSVQVRPMSYSPFLGELIRAYERNATTYYSRSGEKYQHRKYLTINLSKQLLAYSKALSRSLDVISPSHFRYCDPSYNSWIQDVSFFELNGFLQEVVLRYESKSCTASCWDIWHKNACPRAWIDERTGCDGQITSCAWLGDVKGCALANGPRKYQWVQSSKQGMLGNNSDSCPDGQGYHIGTEAREGHKAASACNCDCVGNKWKVYLGPLESREGDNYVIIGVRFRVQNHMLFLQPAQGKLHPNGYIADYEWIDLPDVIPIEYVGNIDFNRRSFFLDDLQLKPRHALTGIQFHAVRRGTSPPIEGFEIRISGRPLDYETGKLDLTPANKCIVAAPETSIEEELIYERVRPNDTEIFERLELSPQNLTYVTLHQSKLIDDFGQSTLPLFDSTPVVMKQHSALAGIAIFHKGSKDNSGFISVQVRPISYSSYLGELIETYKKNATIWKN